jgi:hypothetical protein
VGGPGEHMSASRSLADSPAVPSRHQVADRDTVMETARAILSTHRPHPDDGTCAGCYALWGRWIYFGDCPQVNWVRRAVETYTARDNAPAAPQDRPHDVRVCQLSTVAGRYRR